MNIMNQTIDENEKALPPVYVVYNGLGDVWDFHRMEWTRGVTSNCFSTNPEILKSRWTGDKTKVAVVQYKLTLQGVFK